MKLPSNYNVTRSFEPELRLDVAVDGSPAADMECIEVTQETYRSIAAQSDGLPVDAEVPLL